MFFGEKCFLHDVVDHVRNQKTAALGKLGILGNFKVAFEHMVVGEGWNTLFVRGLEGENTKVDADLGYTVSVFQYLNVVNGKSD